MAQQYDGSIRINTKIDQTGFNKGVAGIQKSVNGLGSSLKSLAGAVGAAFGIAQIVKFGKEAVSLASDLNEVQNVVDTAFGSMSDQVDAWAKNSIKQFGMSELSAKQMASTYMAMSVGSGLQGQGAADMAMKTAERAADISSFYNKSLEESDTMLKSIWTGETESLKQIGVVMTQTNLDAFALANGFGKTTSEMTQSEQIMLRYQYVMNQTRLAAGDFVKTQDSWANQTKILSEQWKQFLSIMGGALIQVLTPALQFLNQFMSVLIGWAQTFAAVVSALFGKQVNTAAGAAQSAMAGASSSAGSLASSTEDAAAAQDSLAGSAKKANKELQKQTASFDEMNILQSQTSDSGSSGGGSSGGGGGSVGGGISVPGFSGGIGEGVTISPDLQNTIDTIQDWFGNVQKAAQPTIDALAGLWEELKRLGTEFIWQGLVDFYNDFLAPLGKWTLSEAFPRFVNALTDGLSKVDYGKITGALDNLWKALEPFAETVGEGLLWLWENFLVPAGTWVANEVLPDFINILAEAVEFLNHVLDALKPLGQWLWEKFLKPLGEWIGWNIADMLNDISGAFQWLNDVISENQEVFDGIVQVVGGIFLATFGGLASIIAAIALNWEELTKVISTWASDTWNSIISAFGTAAEWFNTTVIQPVAKFFTDLWDSVSAWATDTWESIVNAFGSAAQWFNVTVIQPTAQFFSNLWSTISTWASNTWDSIVNTFTSAGNWFDQNVITPIKNFFSAMWEGISTWASNTWNSIVSIWNSVSGWFNSNVIQPVSRFFSGMWDGIKQTFGSVKQWFTDRFAQARDGIKSAWNGVTGFFSGIWNGIKGAFSHVTDWFKDTFSKAWSAVKDVFSTGGKIFDGIKDGIASVFRTVVNGLIAGINKVIAVPFNTINGMLNTIRSIDVMGLKPFQGLWGYNPLYVPQIPKLAQGAVIPPNQQFMAILGDQKNGNNLEGPESLFRQIVREESGNSGISGPVTFILKVGETTLGRATLKSLQDIARQNGGLELDLR